ncbi:hypothetical protein ACTJKO_03245 [Curtobacterium sp. 22159]|uniref:hypothetical protein n=1 Tax=Curtobacterium sp. 22159 TaxID=3453882 RepID=UPI003F872C25
MTVDGPDSGTARQGWPQPQEADDLDRAFGPGTASTPVRTPRQRARRGTLVGVGVIVSAGVLAVALLTIVAGVQKGVGGVFPQPQSALDRFTATARDLDGVERITNEEQDKTGFASYDVSSAVEVSPTLSDDERTAVVDALSRAADAASGNGVRVFAIVDLGNLEIGVSGDQGVTRKRLALARQLDTIGGVTGVHCAWTADAPSDDPRGQVISVETPGTGDVLVAIVAKASHAAHAVFPGAAVTSATPSR